MEQVDVNGLFALSVSQSLQAMVFVALENAYDGALPTGEVYEKWRERYEAAVVRNRMVNEEMEQVDAFLEKDGIWHTMLKGAILQTYYPMPAMRQMTDRDILYDPTAQEHIRRWFTSRGYEVDVYNTGGVVDVYVKKPFYSFEMHSLLFGYSPDNMWREYYENVRERLILDQGKRSTYHFTDEDLYVYLITHGCKHYFNEGNGLRLLLDIYVYLKAKADTLDWAYISRELNTLAVADFEGKARGLCQRIFASPQEFSFASLSADEVAFLSSFLEYGTYGNVENLVKNKVKDHSFAGKLSYAWRRLFPEAMFFKYNYPFFYRHKWLLPVGYVYRIAKRLKVNKKYLTRELSALRRL